MRKYELTLILDPKLKKENRGKLIDKVKSLVKSKAKGKVVEENDWGTKKMEYEIKGHSKGHYIEYDLELDEHKISVFENSLQLQEEILRYLIVSKED